MKTRRSSQLASLAIAAAVSVGLAGCGGSSDNEETVVTPPPVEPAPTGNTIQVTGTASFDLGLDSLEGKDTIEAGKYKAVTGGGRLSCAAGGGDCALTITSNAVSGFTVVSEGGMISYTPPADPEVSGAAAEALRGDLIGTIMNAAGTPDGRRQFGFPGTTSATATGQLKDPHHKANRSGTTNFKKSDDSPVALTGWSGERWMTDDQIIVRYTDQNAKTMTDGTFASRFGNHDGGSGAEITNIGTFVDADDGINAAGDAWEKAESDDFPAANKSETYVAGDGEGTNPPPASLTGKFAGVDGKFTCESSCVISRNSSGALSATGTWAFTAENENASVEYKIQDEDYLAFGWWRESNASGTGIEGFKVLYSGIDVYGDGSAGAVTGVAGTATYNGHAAGNYVKGDEGGEFVANAKLVASFGTSSDAAGIEGTISDFRDSNGDSLGKWEVVATDTNITDAADVDPATNGFGGSAAGAEWERVDMGVSFYGPNANSAHPTGIAGWFHATTEETPATTPWTANDVAVAGAFAATR